MSGFELGLNSFGEVATDASGRALSDAETVRLLVSEAQLAESVGLDVFSVGEHYRAGHNDSASPVLLAAIAGQTERIALGTSVTVLSTNDPVRLYHEFSTLDAVSSGRAQLILGRASATESFPLFGYDLADYEHLFEEKLDLFSQVIKEKPVTWAGELRPPLMDKDIYPRTEGGHLKTWIGVGGSPESVVRAARYELPLVLAIIGGDPARFAPYVDLFHRALAQLEKPDLPIAVHSPGFIADTDQEAAEQYFEHHKAMRDRIGAERGWGPSTRAEFDNEIAHGSLYLGSPETVARKLANTITTLGIQRFDLKYSAGTLPHERMMKSIELYGSKVVPMVKDMLNAR